MVLMYSRVNVIMLLPIKHRHGGRYGLHVSNCKDSNKAITED